MRKLRLVTDSSSKTQTAETSAETAQMLPSDDVSAALFDERFGQRSY
jgi:hypothetical protein